MAESLRNKALKGMVWALLERFSTQIVTFGVGIVLARLLSPTDYGTVAMLGIFTAVATVLADSGFGSALIQKKDATDLDFNSVFYLSIILTTLAYIALFFLAPWVATFYNVPELCPILRVVALSIPLHSINSIQYAEMARKMLFNLSFRISLITTLSSAICGITLAFLGYGAWTLVWMGLTSALVGVVTRWFVIAWRPRIMFSFVSLKPLWKYGWRMTLSALLDTAFNNLYGLIIGKYYSRADLSFVNKGRALPELLMNNVNGTLSRVAFPVLSKMQDDKTRLREAMRRMMLISTFFVFPLMTILAVSAKNVILFLYGDKWLPAVPYAIIACFTFALWPFHTINLQAIQAMGRSDVFLKLEIVKKIIALFILITFLSKSVLAWCIAGACVASPLSVFVNSLPNKRILGYALKDQIVDVLPTALVSLMTAVPLMLFNFISIDSQLLRLAVILLQGSIGLIIFLCLSILFRSRATCEAAALIAPRVLIRFPCVRWLFDFLNKGKPDVV